ncbi:MAG: hypothetical protein J0L94_08135 [Rhodothermia bacterium]|nr:hypothetical protein [Rhodothermia bacterium]
MAFSIILLILVVLMAGLLLLSFIRRRDTQAADDQRFKTEFKREALKDVGIENVRPKQKASQNPPPTSSSQEVSIPIPKKVPEQSQPKVTEVAFVNLRPKSEFIKPTPHPALQTETPSEPKAGSTPKTTSNNPTHPTPVDIQQVFKHTLEAVKVASMAHSVVLLRLGQHHAYIEGILSEEKEIRPYIQIPRSTPFLKALSKTELSVLTASEIGETPLYYANRVELIGLIAAPIFVKNGGLWGYLVADATSTHSVHHPGILSGFAQTIATVITEHQKTTAPQTGPTVWTGHSTRPRKEIISDEIRKARNQNRPLIFALIYLNSHIGEGRELTSDVIVARESELWQGVEKCIRSIGRIERFGELMVGIFLYGSNYQAEEWIGDIQAALTTEMRFPTKAISIGAVLLTDGHADATALLNDAIEALKQVQDGGAALMG